MIPDSLPGKRQFSTGYRSAGMVLSFAALLILLGTGMVTLFLPQLTKAAELSLSLIKTAAQPLGAVLVKFLIFIFGPKKLELGSYDTRNSSSDVQLPTLPDAQDNIFYDIVGWSLSGILLLLTAGLRLNLRMRLRCVWRGCLGVLSSPRLPRPCDPDARRIRPCDPQTTL